MGGKGEGGVNIILRHLVQFIGWRCHNGEDKDKYLEGKRMGGVCGISSGRCL